VTQFVNLLNPALRARRETLSLGLLAAVLAAVALVLAGGRFYAAYRAESAAAQVAAGEAQLRADQERLVAASRALGAAKPDARLVAELDAARAALHARENALAGLAGGSLGNTEGFAEQFRAFARQSVAGLWLTGFTLSGAGAGIRIEGRALKAEQVPAYIRRLNEEPVFRGRSLAALRIEEPRAPVQAGKARPARAEGAPGFVDFRLASAVEAADGVKGSAVARAPGAKP